ncbi:MAG: hypothetical protein KIT87_17555 [Anaerolineae bacterium]|nr:hypothetical protein [Anaerolineae bacterium]
MRYADRVADSFALPEVVGDAGLLLPPHDRPPGPTPCAVSRTTLTCVERVRRTQGSAASACLRGMRGGDSSDVLADPRLTQGQN